MGLPVKRDPERGVVLMKLSRSSLSRWDPGAADLATRVAEYPERVLQIGEGRFMRGFADWLLHRLNASGVWRGRVAVVAPRPTGAVHLARLAEQDNLYTVWQRGHKGGEQVDRAEVVSVISRGIDPYSDFAAFLACAADPAIEVILSNTTEAGLAYQPEPYDPGRPPLSFPGKLTAYLYRRFETFAGDPARGLVIVPCELLEDNGRLLHDMTLACARDWDLPESFQRWVSDHNTFCNTLVDRIVTGPPPAEQRAEAFARFGYEDEFLTACEPYLLFAIEDGGRLRDRWPFAGLGLGVEYVDDVTPFRLRKVRVLNGAHSAFAPVALAAGLDTVGQAIDDRELGPFVTRLAYEEIAPSLPISELEARAYADSILERFRNPYIVHRLQDIMLHALTKCGIRLVPTIDTYIERRGDLPPRLMTALAGILEWYRPGADRPVQDSAEKLAAVQDAWGDGSDVYAAAHRFLGSAALWGRDLGAAWPGAAQAVGDALAAIRRGELRERLRDLARA